ncbi:MAG: HEPN domain-containing protein [Acidobacteria bacterium]|nr:HEPN domain-containing protein [Acidobacteriota bacterium]
MSRLMQGNGDDYPDAAGKHMEDSNVLLAERRYDGAAYLAGYVVECALKTLIQLETGNAEHSHDLGGLCDQLDRLAAQAGARQGKVYLAAEAALRASTVLHNWRPEQRYRGPGVGAAEAGAWNQEAGFAYRKIIGKLRLAGAI